MKQGTQMEEKKVFMTGKLNIRFILRENKFETIMEQEIYPSSLAISHPAFDWPEKVYGGSYIMDDNGTFKVTPIHIPYYLPSIPKSWERMN